MRNRDVDSCYNKLIKFQQILFGMVSTRRWGSEYCEYADGNHSKRERFSAINWMSYEKHKTLEVRLHQGTTDVAKIRNWVNLLLKCINSPEIGAIESKKDVLKFAGRSKKLKEYLKKFKPSWLKEEAEMRRGVKIDNAADSWAVANLTIPLRST